MTHDVVPAEAPRPPRAPLMAGGRPQPIVPQSMEDCYRLANAVCAASMAPRGLDTPEKAMVAIMHGLEIGLTPMAALQRIAVVNGRPTIWGDGAVGLVRGSGLCAWIQEDIEGAGDDMIAVCESMRKGEPRSVKRTFSVEDAKKAGLWGKAGPWQQFPTRMLAMRARAFCLRDGFADVLGGLYLKEELDNGEPEQRRAPSPGPAPVIEARAEAQASRADMVVAETGEIAPASAKPGRRAPSPSAAPGSQPKTAEPAKAQPQVPQHYDPEKVRAKFAAALKAAQDTDAVNEAWNAIIDPIQDGAFPTDLDDYARMSRIREAEINGEEGAVP